MSFMDDLQADLKKQSSNNSVFFWVPDGEKRRIRVLIDAEWGVKLPVHIMWHDTKEEERYTIPCYKNYGIAECPHCLPDAEDKVEGWARYTSPHYGWLIWNYDEKKLQMLFYKSRGSSPLGSLAKFYAAYSALNDRDYMISMNIEPSGKFKKKVYDVIPMDQSKFRVRDVQVPTTKEDAERKQMLMVAEAWCPELAELYTGKKKSAKPGQTKARHDVDEMLDEELEDDGEE